MLSRFDMISLPTFYCLLCMLNGVTYTEVEIQSTAPHFIELFSRQFFRNSPKITNQLVFKSFFGWLLWLTSGISLESVPHGETHKKICLILYDFKNFKKTEGRRVSCFALYQSFTRKFLEHWNINYRQLRLHCPSIFLTWTRQR